MAIKTLFLTIFDLSSLIINVFDCRLYSVNLILSNSVFVFSGFVINPNSKTPVAILQEYVQHVWKSQPAYRIKMLGRSSCSHDKTNKMGVHSAKSRLNQGNCCV